MNTNTFISVILLPFQYIVTTIFSYEIIPNLTIGSVALVAAVFGALISVISRANITLGSGIGRKGSSKYRDTKVGFTSSKKG